MNQTIFDYPCDYEKANIVYIPVPWEATVSYQGGTAHGPKAMLEASSQLDFCHHDVVSPETHGLFLLEIPSEIEALNSEASSIVKLSRKNPADKALCGQVNRLSERCNTWVFEQAQKILDDEKTPVVLGGDHSTPFGAFKAFANRFQNFGILHIDAHHDLRSAYEGFSDSHASIMHNVIQKIPQVSKLTQVAIRDYCQEEAELAEAHPKITTFYDRSLQAAKLDGMSWSKISERIIATLPENIYLSIDVDGFDPKLCPNTGTPVPGGIDFHEFIALLKNITASGRKIIGFDLVEVAPGQGNQWDANVGMRLLYETSAWTLASQGIAERKN